MRLEDHLFVMQAYFAADTISVLASEPCYAWVKEPGSASSARIEPESYFPHLETVLASCRQDLPARHPARGARGRPDPGDADAAQDVPDGVP
ncbi:hypothetical protein CTI14_43230, partial [Methylobacterium radiotolerans]